MSAKNFIEHLKEYERETGISRKDFAVELETSRRKLGRIIDDGETDNITVDILVNFKKTSDKTYDELMNK